MLPAPHAPRSASPGVRSASARASGEGKSRAGDAAALPALVAHVAAFAPLTYRRSKTVSLEVPCARCTSHSLPPPRTPLTCSRSRMVPLTKSCTQCALMLALHSLPQPHTPLTCRSSQTLLPENPHPMLDSNLFLLFVTPLTCSRSRMVSLRKSLRVTYDSWLREMPGARVIHSPCHHI